MEPDGGMLAGSHTRNQLHRIRHHSTHTEPKPLHHLSAQICQICGDTVGPNAHGDIFVACNECAFPVCRPCYEYERKDGNRACPQCKTRYKRLKGSPRVDGDDDEDDIDDLHNEFNHASGNNKARNQWQGDAALSSSSRHESHQPIPLLTNGQPMSGEVPNSIADTQSIRSTSGPLGPGDKHGLPFVDPRQPVPVRIVDPSKDLNSYGLGSVDWILPRPIPSAPLLNIHNSSKNLISRKVTMEIPGTLLKYRVHVLLFTSLSFIICCGFYIAPSFVDIIKYFWPLLASTTMFLFAVVLFSRIAPPPGEHSSRKPGEGILEYVVAAHLQEPVH